MLTEANIKCFLSLGKTLNITDTALEMELSPQSVNRHIEKLESRIGHALFTRSKNLVQLTPDGVDFYQFFLRYADAYQQLQSMVSSRKAPSRQTIKLGLLDWANIGSLLSATLDRLSQELPDMQVQFSFQNPGSLLFDLEQGKHSMIVIFERYVPAEMRDGRYRLLPLAQAELSVSAASSHPLAATATGYMDFANEPFIVDNFAMESREDTIKRAKLTADRLGLTPSRFIVSPNRETAYTLCECGRGCLLTAEVSGISSSHSLCRFPTGLTDNIVCVSPVDFEVAATERMAQLLREEFSNLKGN